MYDLSILIPARNEMFLVNTVENILQNIEGNTEIIIALDGEWADPPINDDPRVTIVHYSESIGQRAATNAICRLSKAKWVLKCDAHCVFDKGFDVKLMDAMKGHDDWTMVPIMKNLHAFDWVCDKCGQRWYQGPTPTFCHKDYEKTNDVNPNCDNKTDFHRDIMFEAKRSPNSSSYCFDSTPHFQYFSEYRKRPEFQKDYDATRITESMSLQGSCFMLTRDKYWELNICDEKFGSWGSQGIEVACKTWLSGGRVVCNHNTWYAHLFRTQGGDFGFPYPQSGNQVKNAREMAKSYFVSGDWKQQTKPLSWLLSKFWPVPGWDYIPGESINPPEYVVDTRTPDVVEIQYPNKVDSIPYEGSKGIIFYTDNLPNHKIAHAVQKKLRDTGLPIVSASLKPMTFGENIYFPLKRGYLTMFKQILGAIESSKTEYIFFCEHDVLYHPSHFEFTPPTKDKFYYNENVWKLNTANGHAIHYDCKQVSGICVSRELALEHYRKRLAILEEKYQQLNEEDFNRYIRAMGFEPGTHNRPERVDDLKAEGWFSTLPNVDIRHGLNLTASRWSKEQFRDQRNCPNWIEADEIPGWGKMEDYLKI